MPPRTLHVARRAPLWILKAALIFGLSGAADAHVKWFCGFDVAGQPVGLANVLCADFEALTGFTIFMLVAAGLIEKTPLGVGVVRAIIDIMAPMRRHSDVMIRAVAGFFFVSLWGIGDVIITPELKTTSAFVPLLQLAIAVCLVWRRTLVLSAVGIVVLYAIALHDYGLFHLLDYPIFLGLAAYLALTGLDRQAFGMRPLDIARWAASLTLMWASIEKWAYPVWTSPLFISHPKLAMGFSTDFFMQAAGAVEFGLSFALIWTPLCRRVSALILMGMFLAAVQEFGKIDAIGHSCIIALMLAIAADDRIDPVRAKKIMWTPVGYAAALVGVLLGYYELHSVMFGTTLT
jgi:hypothetical protein